MHEIIVHKSYNSFQPLLLSSIANFHLPDLIQTLRRAQRLEIDLYNSAVVIRALSPEKACRCFSVSSLAIQRQFHHGTGSSESLHKEISRLLLTTPQNGQNCSCSRPLRFDINKMAEGATMGDCRQTGRAGERSGKTWRNFGLGWPR